MAESTGRCIPNWKEPPFSYRTFSLTQVSALDGCFFSYIFFDDPTNRELRSCKLPNVRNLSCTVRRCHLGVTSCRYWWTRISRLQLALDVLNAKCSVKQSFSSQIDSYLGPSESAANWTIVGISSTNSIHRLIEELLNITGKSDS